MLKGLKTETELAKSTECLKKLYFECVKLCQSIYECKCVIAATITTMGFSVNFLNDSVSVVKLRSNSVVLNSQC